MERYAAARVHARNVRLGSHKADWIPPMTGKYVVIRTINAGVHVGTLTSLDTRFQACRLADARRIWSWVGANTLHEISLTGPTVGKISEAVEDIILCGVIEVIPCTDAARDRISGIQWT